MSATPLAFALGIVALFKDESKKYAMAALAISILTELLWLVTLFCV